MGSGGLNTGVSVWECVCVCVCYRMLGRAEARRTRLMAK